MAWVLPEVDAAGNAIRYGYTALGAPYPIVPETVYQMGTAAKAGIITAGTAVASAGLYGLSGWAPLMPNGAIQEHYTSPYGGATGSRGAGTIDTRPPPGPIAGRRIPSMKNPKMPSNVQHKDPRPVQPPWAPPPVYNGGFGPDTDGVALPPGGINGEIPWGSSTTSAMGAPFHPGGVITNRTPVSFHTTGKMVLTGLAKFNASKKRKASVLLVGSGAKRKLSYPSSSLVVNVNRKGGSGKISAQTARKLNSIANGLTKETADIPHIGTMPTTAAPNGTGVTIADNLSYSFCVTSSTAYGSAASTTGLLSGTADNAMVNSVRLLGKLSNPAAAGAAGTMDSLVRIMLVYFTKPLAAPVSGGALPPITEVLLVDSVYSNYVPENRRLGFSIISDKTYNLGTNVFSSTATQSYAAVSGQNHARLDHLIKVNKQVHFNEPANASEPGGHYDAVNEVAAKSGRVTRGLLVCYVQADGANSCIIGSRTHYTM